ncbi:hypothetical protein PGB28_17115 [Primorskyibacter aestuariivivens]|uniref:hypothetical protein n=1 Tax=Primorskyibacter aestuariivivens TaxID=1888912 RepID=UPI0023009055|nr:hypothetical protein [Primorskyibacter aestuariivivens]MDA7430186.1 hypothetical protein [Primorskyibacter aestuariivivens]
MTGTLFVLEVTAQQSPLRNYREDLVPSAHPRLLNALRRHMLRSYQRDGAGNRAVCVVTAPAAFQRHVAR